MTMTTTRDAEELLSHMAWSDGTVWTAILELAPPFDEQLRTLCHHVHGVQHAYAQLLEGREPDVPDLSEADTLRSIMAWGARAHDALRRCVREMDSEALERSVPVPWASHFVAEGGTPEDVTAGQALLQVVLHSSYHRGQVNRRIRELGGEPPLVDFVVWVWRGRPDGGWPEPAPDASA